MELTTVQLGFLDQVVMVSQPQSHRRSSLHSSLPTLVDRRRASLPVHSQPADTRSSAGSSADIPAQHCAASHFKAAHRGERMAGSLVGLVADGLLLSNQEPDNRPIAGSPVT